MDSFLWHVYSVSHIVLATGTMAVSKIDRSLPLWSFCVIDSPLSQDCQKLKGGMLQLSIRTRFQLLLLSSTGQAALCGREYFVGETFMQNLNGHQSRSLIS